MSGEPGISVRAAHGREGTEQVDKGNNLCDVMRRSNVVEGGKEGGRRKGMVI